MAPLVQPWVSRLRSALPEMPRWTDRLPSPNPSDSAAGAPPRQGTDANRSLLSSDPESNTSAVDGSAGNSSPPMTVRVCEALI